MARLLTVVNERKKIRGEYRKILEDQYIAQKKQEEIEEQKAERERLKEQGINAPLTDDEVKAMVKAKASQRLDEYNKLFEKLKEKTSKEETAASPLLDEKDLKLVASAQTKLT